MFCQISNVSLLRYNRDKLMNICECSAIQYGLGNWLKTSKDEDKNEVTGFYTQAKHFDLSNVTNA